MPSSTPAGAGPQLDAPAPVGTSLSWINRTLGLKCKLPEDVLMFLYVLLDHVNRNPRHPGYGYSWLKAKALSKEMRRTEVVVNQVVRSAEQLEVVTYQEIALEYGFVGAWKLNVGHAPPPDQLHLRHSLTSRVRNREGPFQGICDRHQLFLEAGLRVGYDWLTGEIVTTRAELAAELPEWSDRKLRCVSDELNEAGILRVTRQGRGAHPARRRLALVEDSAPPPLALVEDSAPPPLALAEDSAPPPLALATTRPYKNLTIRTSLSDPPAADPLPQTRGGGGDELTGKEEVQTPKNSPGRPPVSEPPDSKAAPAAVDPAAVRMWAEVLPTLKESAGIGGYVFDYSKVISFRDGSLVVEFRDSYHVYRAEDGDYPEDHLPDAVSHVQYTYPGADNYPVELLPPALERCVQVLRELSPDDPDTSRFEAVAAEYEAAGVQLDAEVVQALGSKADKSAIGFVLSAFRDALRAADGDHRRAWEALARRAGGRGRAGYHKEIGRYY